ncbi:MAG: pilus assembly protein [Candidimonas sp.]|nr:MAG: pilus assembly protein [Candidimonas sp.]TAM26300.1 MAG: pilus assembly protein [Candidimonas sp.]TAM75122.1 MAG: pilus assembly protein [Candidimonas sp.]
MIIVFLLCMAILAGVAAWLIQGWCKTAYRRYQWAFQREAKARLSEFFLFFDPAQLWFANLLFCAGLTLFIYMLSGVSLFAGGAGAVALLAPQFLIARWRRRRLARFDEQLPDLLAALAAALRAGSGMQAALRHIVLQAPAPLAQEFGLMLREQRMGVSFEQALASLYGRVPTEGTGLVVSSLKIAVQSGGNLAETLERIAGTLRARLHLLAKVDALTSQGRLQAWVMSCLPFALMLVLEYIDPDSMAYLWNTPAGWAVLSIVVSLELTGALFIRRIVGIDV